MSQIQKRLESLKPYIIGIRFVENMPIVDSRFLENWIIPDSKIVSKAISEEDPSHYMFYSENTDIGFDDLLDYIESIIKFNIELEEKQNLLRVKINELKILFKDTPLIKLNRLKFVLDDADESLNSISESDIKMIENSIVEPKIRESEKPAVLEVKPQTKQVLAKIELPPKKIELEDHSIKPKSKTCTCGPNEACPVCMDEKDL